MDDVRRAGSIAGVPVPRRMAVRAVPGALLALAVGAGCGYRAPAVPVTGSATALAALAGDWAGDYSSPATGRSGTITFILRSATDSAFGEVVMVPEGATTPLFRARSTGEPSPRDVAAGPRSDVLRIRFVRAEGDSVTGSLDPYRAPDCACVLTTTFTGALRGDAIEGTFVTTGEPIRELRRLVEKAAEQRARMGPRS